MIPPTCMSTETRNVVQLKGHVELSAKLNLTVHVTILSVDAAHVVAKMQRQLVCQTFTHYFGLVRKTNVQTFARVYECCISNKQKTCGEDKSHKILL